MCHTKVDHMKTNEQINVNKLMKILKVNLKRPSRSSHVGRCGGCVDGWFTASPGLSQTDWTLAGWGCTPGVHESNHGTQDKPAINTHTQEEPQPWQLYHQLGEYHQPETPINTLNNIYPCPVSEGPKESHLGGVRPGGTLRQSFIGRNCSASHAHTHARTQTHT